MRRLKPIFVVCWTALWLVGALHCPLEALGVFTDDHCCVASADKAGCPGKSGCSYEESARWLSVRVEDVVPAPDSIAPPDLSLSVEPCSILTFEPARLDDQPSVLPQSWQFRWRTALTPRAPSFLG